VRDAIDAEENVYLSIHLPINVSSMKSFEDIGIGIGNIGGQPYREAGNSMYICPDPDGPGDAGGGDHLGGADLPAHHPPGIYLSLTFISNNWMEAEDDNTDSLLVSVSYKISI
jgi:hypothetical protein